jgi:hypothetical protein
MPTEQCDSCGGQYTWCWEEAFCKFGFGDGDHRIETPQVEDVLVEAGYTVVSQQWGFHNVIIISIEKDGQEFMPVLHPDYVIGYDDPRDYLPKEITELLDARLPAEGAEYAF